MEVPRLIAKYFIAGTIETKTGLHVGGSKNALDIGGVDLNVIKTHKGHPYIPGSSLKGKLRSLLAYTEGRASVETDTEEIKTIFGSANTAEDKEEGQAARLIVRDAMLDAVHAEKEKLDQLELGHTEVKWENSIDRRTGTADNPRQVERVPAGAHFDFEMVYNAFEKTNVHGHLDTIRKALRLLEDDYIGGQGSRGYGKIKFLAVTLRKKTIDDYQTGSAGETMTEHFLKPAEAGG